MSIDVLLSIKPVFAKAIFSGKKIYEFRKSVFKDMTIRKVYVYASAPISVAGPALDPAAPAKVLTTPVAPTTPVVEVSAPAAAP